MQNSYKNIYNITAFIIINKSISRQVDQWEIFTGIWKEWSMKGKTIAPSRGLCLSWLLWALVMLRKNSVFHFLKDSKQQIKQILTFEQQVKRQKTEKIITFHWNEMWTLSYLLYFNVLHLCFLMLNPLFHPFDIPLILCHTVCEWMSSENKRIQNVLF